MSPGTTPRPPARIAPSSGARSATPKRHATRGRVIEAAIAVVDEVGLVDASAAAIAKRSGVSWGVIQYHFGDRLGLLLAVVDHATTTYERQIEAIVPDDRPVPERARSLVERTWRSMTTPSYRSLLEIQLHLGRVPEVSADYRSLTRRADHASRRVWRVVFADVPAGRVDAAHDHAVATLRGLAVSHALGTAADSSRPVRDAVVVVIAGALGGR
jgi:AcrR family transcriptional regulator